ncbi:MAG: TIR domain-containing protein [Phycisphaerae bacterium]|nr:TIR domain-containing protein [Phycisphaerae bacterium]
MLEVEKKMSEKFRYDVFLSYSAKDKPIMSELAQRLKADGLHIWFNEWEIQPGDMIGERIEEGLEASRVLVFALSRHTFESEWGTLERQTFQFRDPANRGRRFIPLRLDDAETKDALRQFAFVDWRNRASEEYGRLLAQCQPPCSPGDAPVVFASQEQPLHRPVSLCHPDAVTSVALSADGCRIFSGSLDRIVRVWSLEEGCCIAALEGHTAYVRSVAPSADGHRVLSGAADSTVCLWDIEKRQCIAVLQGHTAAVNSVALSADGRRALSGAADKTLRLWDLERGRCIVCLEGHGAYVNSVALSADGRRALSGAADNTVQFWDLERAYAITFTGHTAAVNSVALSADGQRALSGAADSTVRLWDLERGCSIATLEGHTAAVNSVAFSADGQRALSGAADNTVRLWDLEKGGCLVTLQGHTAYVNSVALSTDGRYALSGAADNTVRLWTLGQAEKKDSAVPPVSVRYTNAKVLLVGESGVGKTGLMHRLTQNCFKGSISTDAIWATRLALPDAGGPAGVKREMWLWDFAGQADYRLIHQLFMDETALAVFVFNPQSENPFEGLGSWDRDLQRAARRRFNKLLVAGRIDCGGLMVSRDSIERFRRERGFAEYIETSALQGTGCDELCDAIRRHIPWDEIPYTASPRIFRLLKNEIVKLKEEGIVLLRMGEIKQRLEMRLPAENFTVEQLQAVVGLLAGPGVVWQLEFGDFVLLQPERINSYAAAVVRSVRAHMEEIGCIAEEDVLAGKLDYQDMKRLPHDEEQIVLRAMHQIFVDHGLCLREHTEKGTLLVFPSYFKRERPEQTGHPAILVTYQFSGALDEIYATLVVRLHHTAAFDKDQLWRFAADFKTQGGKRLGLRMTKKAEGAAEIEAYFDKGVPEDTQVTFIRYIHDHLKAKAVEMTRVRHYVCSNPRCGEPVESARAIQKAMERRAKSIPCQFCGGKIVLRDLIEEKFASEKLQQQVRELDQQAHTSIDNESRELAAEAHTMFIVAEAGQIWRRTAEPDWGIDGEIEFRDYQGNASGRRLYVQLKSGDSYLRVRKQDAAEVFRIKEQRWAEYWQQQAYPVMLVIRTSDGAIRWMDVSEYLRRESQGGKKAVKQIVFEGELLTAWNLLKLREKLLDPPPTPS